MPNKVREIEDKDGFKEIVNCSKDVLVVIDFFAEWCGPCKHIGPKFKRMAEEITDVIFAKVDVDDHEDLAEDHEISVMPTFVLYKNKKVVGKLLGSSADQLRELIEKHK